MIEIGAAEELTLGTLGECCDSEGYPRAVASDTELSGV
jgi:hypothetical protein